MLWGFHLVRQSSRFETGLISLPLVASVDEGRILRRLIHRPVNLPILMVVLADLQIEAFFTAVFENVPGKGQEHRPVL